MALENNLLKIFGVLSILAGVSYLLFVLINNNYIPTDLSKVINNNKEQTQQTQTDYDFFEEAVILHSAQTKKNLQIEGEILQMYKACEATTEKSDKPCETIQENQKQGCFTRASINSFLISMGKSKCPTSTFKENDKEITSYFYPICSGVSKGSCEQLQDNQKIICQAIIKKDYAMCNEIIEDNIIKGDIIKAESVCKRIVSNINAIKEGKPEMCDGARSSVIQTDICKGLIEKNCDSRLENFVEDFTRYYLINVGEFDKSKCSTIKNEQIKALCKDTKTFEEGTSYIVEKNWGSYE